MTTLWRAHAFALVVGCGEICFVKNNIGQPDGVVSKQDKLLFPSPRELLGFQ
jgi:hypothetical protein